jgi:molybdate transport system regulatory protein
LLLLSAHLVVCFFRCRTLLDSLKPEPPAVPDTAAQVRVRLRLQAAESILMGPGRADVLQGVAETGSIAEAGRRLGMSYQRVWSLVKAMNEDFVEPLVTKQRGGAAGGGAALTPTGERVLAAYRKAERAAQKAAAKPLLELRGLLR